MPFGCRMGICHTCVGKLCSGEVRDLRTGEVHGSEGEMIRTCVNAPEGADRDRTLTTERETMTAVTTEIESPLSHLSSEQIDELGREFDAIRDRVFADLGERDRRYIESMIEMQRRLAVISRALLLGLRNRPARSPARPPSRWPRSSRTWRSATTSCTASGTG